VVPALWERFIPHFTRPGKLANRLIAIPDNGINLSLGNIRLQALPAHFLHSEGNYSFYDPVSKFLFSGDIGANFPPDNFDEPISKLKNILPFMENFHRRYMSSNRVCTFWVDMIRTLDIEAIVPQHGRPFVDKRVVSEFLEWFERLDCGVDLITQDFYRVPNNDA
jgi:flavorubredoxin